MSSLLSNSSSVQNHDASDDDEHNSFLQPDEIELQHQFFYFPPSDSIDDLDDEVTVHYGLPQRPGKIAILMMGCCPCLTNNPCSDEKKLEYKNIPKTIVFFLSVVQIGLFCISISLNGLAPIWDNWMIGPPGESLIRVGAKYGPLMRYKYQIWRMITPIFLHSGIIQLVVNLFYQLRMGLYLEPRWGWSKFVIVYFVSGSAGIAISCVFSSNSVSVAASFAMIGVMGAWFAQLHMTWETWEGWQKKMNLSVCLVIILITFCEGIGPSFINFSGHFGGLFMGLSLGYLFFGWKAAISRDDKLLAKLIPIAGVLFIILYFFVMLGLFYTIIPVDMPPSDEETQSYYYSNTTSSLLDYYLSSDFVSSSSTISQFTYSPSEYSNTNV